MIGLQVCRHSWRAFCLIVCGGILGMGTQGSPADEPEPPRPEASDSPMANGRGYRELFAGLLSDAHVRTGTRFRGLARSEGQGQPMMAPTELRRALLSWDASVIRNSVRAYYRFEDGQVSLTWRLEWLVPEQPDEARPKLVKALRAQGFEETNGRLKTYLAEKYGKMASREFFTPKQAKTFRRQSGNTIEEILAVGLNGALTGSKKYETEIRLDWVVAREWRGEPPMLRELLAACPVLSPPPPEDPFYESLRDEPVYEYGGGYRQGSRYTGWGATFSEAVRPDLEALLSRLGFRFREAIPLPSPDFPTGTEQRTWERLSDYTYAHITILDKLERLEFGCQAPQKKPD